MKKKAYTLTELLVVVMIIAVLAAVVLPKFNKVLETRKTTEAEDLMTAIRQEQEYRCAADRPYAENVANLKSVASAKAKNYTLALTGTGVEAKRNGKSYQLSIPSYADGRICCDDINDSGLCAELNRDYPTCTELRAKADFKASPETCAAATPPLPPPPQCTNGATEYTACSNSCGMSGTRLVNECVNGSWQARNGSCSATDSQCSCNAVSGEKPRDFEEQCSTCGTRTVTYNCSGAPNWQWVSSPGACSRTEDQCDCDPNTKPADSTESCNECGTRTITYTCNTSSWSWEPSAGACNVASNEECCSPEGAVSGSEACSTCGGVRPTRACVDGRWVSQRGECTVPQDQCHPCNSLTSECVPGTIDMDRGNLCTVGSKDNTVLIRQDSIGPFQQEEPTHDIVTEPAGKIGDTKQVYFGAICNDQCKWESIPCPTSSTSSGHGGGGGGSSLEGGGGCSHGVSYTQQYTNFDAGSRYTWCTVTYVCTGRPGMEYEPGSVWCN